MENGEILTNSLRDLYIECVQKRREANRIIASKQIEREVNCTDALIQDIEYTLDYYRDFEQDFSLEDIDSVITFLKTYKKDNMKKQMANWKELEETKESGM